MATENRLKRFYGATAVYLISNTLNAAIPFALLPILTRYLNPTEYGQVAIFQSLVAGVIAFTGLSIDGAANRKFFDKNAYDYELKEFITSGLYLSGLVAGLVLLIAYGVRNTLQDWLGIPPIWIYSTALVSFSMMFIKIRLGQWQVQKRPLPFGALQIFYSLLNFGTSMILVILLLRGASGRIEGYIISTVIISVFAITSLSRNGLLGFFSCTREKIREILEFGVPLIPHAIGVYVLTSLDRIIVGQHIGLDQAGIYMVAAQLGMGVRIIFDAINKGYVPWLFETLKKNDRKELERTVQNTYIAFFLISFLAGAAFFFMPPILILVAGDDYAAAGEIVGWVVAAQCCTGMYLLVTNYLFYSRRNHILSGITILAGIVHVILLIFLIEEFGALGAGVAMFLSSLIRFLATWRAAAIVHPMPWNEGFKKWGAKGKDK